jgi:hypothetical protein
LSLIAAVDEQPSPIASDSTERARAIKQQRLMSRENPHMTQSPRLDLRPGISEPVVLMISRREVEAADLASVVSRLKIFLATREDAWRYRGQMTLVVDGYNNDPRELVDIPEVRALLRGLEAEWPYWAYFFNQVDDSIKLLLSCVAGCRFLGRGAVEMDADLVASALARGFGGMNIVFDRFGFPEDELETMSNGLVEVLQQAGMA